MRYAAQSARARIRIKRVLSVPSRPPHGFALPWALMLAGTLAGGNALALVLDAVVEQSLLGEPLRIVIPVEAQPGEELAGGCFRIVPSRVGTDDGMPNFVAARVALEKTAGSNRLVVTTPGPINDLAIRLTVHAGCEYAIQREYVILFDPPLVEAPGSDGAARPSRAGAAIEAPVSEVSTSDAAPAAKQAAPPPITASRAAVHSGGEVGLPPATARKSAVGDTGLPTHSPTVGTQPVPRSTPRLEISRTVQAPGQGGKAADGAFGELPKSAQIAALEVQEVVLGKRVIELLEQVERMQRQRIAELTAQVERLEQDRRAADAARRDTPWAVFLRWLGEFWPILVAVPVVAALATGILVWRRRRISGIAPSVGDTPLFAGIAGTMSEQAYGNDSLFEGPQTVPSHGTVPRDAAANVGVDTLASRLSEPEEAFDRDIAQQVGSRAKPPHTSNR